MTPLKTIREVAKAVPDACPEKSYENSQPANEWGSWCPVLGHEWD